MLCFKRRPSTEIRHEVLGKFPAPLARNLRAASGEAGALERVAAAVELPRAANGVAAAALAPMSSIASAAPTVSGVGERDPLTGEVVV